MKVFALGMQRAWLFCHVILFETEMLTQKAERSDPNAARPRLKC
jgi:hypothetical protein